MSANRFRRLVLISAATVLMLGGAPPAGQAGVDLDPNLGDEVSGRAGGVRYASDTSTFDAGSGFAQAEVGCGNPAWRPVGGGGAAGGPPPGARLAASRPHDFDDPDFLGDDGWYAAGGGVNPAGLTGYSICIRNEELRYRSKDVPDDLSGLRSASVGCAGHRWRATGGGAIITTGGSWITSSYPIDGPDQDHIRDDGWQARVYDTIGGAGGFVVYVVCISGRDVRHEQRHPISVSAGGSRALTARCRVGEHVVGGGARLTGPQDEGRLTASFPIDGPDADLIPDDGWRTRAYNVMGEPKRLAAYAVCLS